MKTNDSINIVKIIGETYFGAPKSITIWKRKDSNSLRISIGSNTDRGKNKQIVVDLEHLKAAIAELEK